MSKNMCYGEEARTDLGKTPNGKTSDEEDRIRRLPVEIFVYILTIVADSKSLCKCSIVSKYFAWVVFRVRDICVTIPESSVPPKPKPKSKWLVFLEQFRELESICLEYKYKYPVNRAYSPVSKWKVKFSTNFHEMEIFVSLFFSPDCKKAAKRNRLTCTERERLDDGRSRCLEWMGIVFMLGKSHMSLKRVIITDSQKAGKIVIGEEQLVRLRSSDQEPKPLELLRRPQVVEEETASLNVLELPSLGYALRYVYLRILDFRSEPHSSAMDEISAWDFEDVVLGEAIKEICENRIGNIRIRKTSLLA